MTQTKREDSFFKTPISLEGGCGCVPLMQDPTQRHKAQITSFLLQTHLLKRVIVNHINNRTQEFSDPITSTLILMATTPMQMIFCEEGLLLFKTTNLPIFPYSALQTEDKQFLLQIMQETEDRALSETYHGCGKYSVQMHKGHYGYVPKRNLLLAFVEIMLDQDGIKDRDILQRLCDIIIQRFLSSVSVHSDDITAVMDTLWPPADADNEELSL